MIMRNVFKICRSLRKDDKGIAALEAALYMPVLVFVSMAVIELGMIMFVSTLLEGSLREASRYGITGQEKAGVTRIDYIRDLMDTAMIGLVDVDTATIEVKTYPSFADIEDGEPFIDGNGNSNFDEGETYTDVNGNGSWDADMGIDGPGGAGEVVRYTVEVDWEILSPLMKPIFGAENGHMPLRASMTVRNEPWEN
jgi:hypothetical protein